MVMIYGQGTFDNYRAALAAVGLETEVSTDTAVARRCEGLLLPGGGDIFGGLDRRETAVINAFVARRRPVLGICRGIQALNVYFGGTLHDQIAGHQLAAGDMVHPTCAEGLPAELLGDAPYVTSNHHQAVNALGRGLSDCQWGVGQRDRGGSPYVAAGSGGTVSPGAAKLFPPPGGRCGCRAALLLVGGADKIGIILNFILT